VLEDGSAVPVPGQTDAHTHHDAIDNNRGRVRRLTRRGPGLLIGADPADRLAGDDLSKWPDKQVHPARFSPTMCSADPRFSDDLLAELRAQLVGARCRTRHRQGLHASFRADLRQRSSATLSDTETGARSQRQSVPVLRGLTPGQRDLHLSGDLADSSRDPMDSCRSGRHAGRRTQERVRDRRRVKPRAKMAGMAGMQAQLVDTNIGPKKG